MLLALALLADLVITLPTPVEKTLPNGLKVIAMEDRSTPVGVCVLVDDVELMRRHPEAVWPDTGFLFAGYQADGRQVRIRYFDGARIA